MIFSARVHDNKLQVQAIGVTQRMKYNIHMVQSNRDEVIQGLSMSWRRRLEAAKSPDAVEAVWQGRTSWKKQNGVAEHCPKTVSKEREATHDTNVGQYLEGLGKAVTLKEFQDFAKLIKPPPSSAEMDEFVAKFVNERISEAEALVSEMILRHHAAASLVDSYR